jgi:diguanylate cyclase (GGDEF)-like protein
VIKLDFNALDLLNFSRWNRRILNVYWIVIAITIAVSLLSLQITDKEPLFFFKRYILLPAVILVTLMILMELTYHFYKKSTNLLPYFVITCGAFLSTITIASHSSVKPILSILLLPILVSCIYYRKQKVIFASILSALLFLTLVWLEPHLNQSLNMIEVITMLAILLGGSFISIGTMARGLEILNHLKTSMESSRDLMTEKILMEKMAKTDALTGLDNHMSFHKYMDELLHYSDNQGFSIQLALLDIDNFKQVNDTYGHHVGDKILKFTSKKVKEMISPNDFVARYGGEEFAVIFVEKSLEESYRIIENIRQEIASISHKELAGKRVTISAGLHEHFRGSGKDQLFEGADEALYEAKRTGKNKTVIYSKSTQQLNYTI